MKKKNVLIAGIIVIIVLIGVIGMKKRSNDKVAVDEIEQRLKRDIEREKKEKAELRELLK